ncbi:MAG: MotA/TolQ/ExbB proton channel family protein [bacterium]|nr:MotA/TolQ/ExbB proton channel family protein [bacterium]
MFGEMSIIEFMIASPTMLVLAICSIVTVGFAVERIHYFSSTRSDTRRFMNELGNAFKSGNPRTALDVCNRSNSPVGRIMAQGVLHLGRSRDELQQRLDTAIDLETVEMERNLSILGTMSNIAPLLGLFGTVVGIIRAFADMARTGSGGGAVVAMGVSEALLTTAAGIVVAVIATVAFNFFVRQIRTRTAQLEDAREAYFTLWHQNNKRARQNTGVAASTKVSTGIPNSMPAAKSTQKEEPLSTILS